MLRLQIFGAIFVAASWRSATATDAAGAVVDSVTSNDDSSQCGLYLAISSTSSDDENTAWGIYAGKDYETGETVGVPELAINTHNLRFNVVNPKAGPLSASIAKSLGFLEENFWVGEMAGAKYELENGRSIALISGSGSLGAGSPKLTNANWSQQKTYQRKPVGERAGDPHPSRGAISPFYDAVLRTLSPVKAGSEIFVDYGNSFDDKDEEEDELKKDDYSRLDETINQMIEFFDKHKAELDGDSKREIYNFITKDVMTAAVGASKAKRIASILPRTPDELVEVKAMGGIMQFTQPSSSRPSEWLQEHGLCMDNLRVGASTILNAGRGAFATRAIKKGTTVVPVPVLQIPNHSIMDIYSLAPNGSGELVRVNNTVIGKQLLVNYCFGHKESTMLLAPTGSNVGLINHNDEPNAKLVWSNHPSHEKHWLQLPPEQLVKSDNAFVGLLLEVVALRYILPGEEVFIDYGKEWKKAWDEHEKQWQERLLLGDLPKQWPIRALDMNAEYATKPYLTRLEHELSPYPENVELTAFIMLKQDGATGKPDDPRTWAAPSPGQSFTWENLVEFDFVESVSAADGSYVYTIKWTTDHGEVVYVQGVPHDAFTFVDVPESSDQFTSGAFRHYIGLPDEIFPQGAWRNAI